MTDALVQNRPADSVPLVPVEETAVSDWLATQGEALRAWVARTGFTAAPGSLCPVPGERGALERVLVGVRGEVDPWCLGALPDELAPGTYHLDASWDTERLELAALGFALGAYQFTRYRARDRVVPRLAVDEACDLEHVRALADAVYLTRDLVNTPAGDMLPGQLYDAAEALAAEFEARCTQVMGEDLLAQGYPSIHAVGRASASAPRLIDLRWGDPSAPRVTLVGKGVCFDSGGLDLKGSTNMRLMKKDMGGAAHALALARLVMGAGLAVHLRVLIPAVENAVAGNAFRPGDVIRTRAGLTVEVHNTDAEGRIVLCDALSDAVDESPAVLLDFATLTGAARSALGTDVPALFCNDDALAAGLCEASGQVHDPLWRMPLHAPYRELLDSRVADLSNAAATPYAGAITAALFLQSFVPDAIPWAHLDLMAWNPKSRPGRPEGGEAMGLRATWDYLRRRFASG